MKQLVLMAALLAAFAGVMPAGDAEGDVTQLIEAQVQAWNRGDLDGFMQTYWKSEQTAFVGAGGVTRGWQAVRDRYRHSYPNREAMGTLTFSDLEITLLSPKAALVLGRWQLKRAADAPGGVFTLVVRRLPEGWRIVHDHTSAVAQRGN